MYLALIGFSLYISYIDLKSHRISNRSLALGFPLFLTLAYVQGQSLYLKSALLCAAISPLLIKAKIGAGDVKLLILLALFFLPNTLLIWSDFLSLFSTISVALILHTGLKERTLQSSIALAPAICGAVIWCAS